MNTHYYTHTFKATCDDMQKYNGTVEIVRELTAHEADPEAGKMFKCRTLDGKEFDAFADELGL